MTSVPCTGARALRVFVPFAAAAALAVTSHAAPSLTVYSHDLGLVRDTRTLDLAGGRDTVRIPDVPERIDFGSVRLVPAGAARVTRLAYRFDVENGDALIDHARGNRVRVTSRGDKVTEGALIAADGAWLIVRTDDGGINALSRTAVEDVRLARPPATLSLRPALEAVVEGGRGRTEAQLSYLTGGLSWEAEHVVVRKGEDALTWSSTVTVENTTGRDYVDAELKLVAGEPRRDVQSPPRPMFMERAMSVQSADAKQVDLSEQSFSEYHLYTLGRPATLRDRERQSLTMIEPHTVQVTPHYVYRGGDARGVQAQLEFQNTRAAGLGVPLPAGRVRIYEPDPTGDVQFTGEARIAHTPEGEKVTLEMGTAFDLVAERKQTSERRISDREREYAIEIALRNRKAKAVTIRVEEPIGGDYDLVKQTHPSTKKDASTIVFEVAVPAGKEVTVGYTARVRY